ncbi:MAG: autotransporter-associated beta strand repeat-containing protein, partial [Pirellulales bacterium]
MNRFFGARTVRIVNLFWERAMRRHDVNLFSANRGTILRASLALAAALAFSASAAAQFTWTGDFFGVWNQALNWSPNGIPNSPTAAVDFTGNALGTVNISSNVQTQSLTFSNPTGAYSLTSSAGVSLSSVTAINVAAGVTGTQTINLANVATGSLRFPALNNLTITNDSTAAGTTLVIGPTTVIGTPGSGAVIVDGPGTTQISGSFAIPGTGNAVIGGLIRRGAGTLILSNPANVYTGGTLIHEGALLLGAGTAIPTGTAVTVENGGQFNTNGLSNTAATAIGTLEVRGASTFRVPSGSGDYHLNRLRMLGGTVDFTGASNFWLHLTGSFDGITTNASLTTATWIGGGASRIQNDTALDLFITINAGSTPSGIDLDAGINLANGIDNRGFIKSGAGTMRLSSLGNTANITVSEGALRVDDMSTSGVGALGTGIITLDSGILQYGGPSATSTKNLTLTSTSVVQVFTPGANLTLNGTINSGVGGFASLVVLGPGAGQAPSTLTLGATNNYGLQTVVRDNAILAIPTISNQGLASPIGLDFGQGIGLGGTEARGTLLLTGTNPAYTTNRRFEISGLHGNQGGGAVGVQNAGTNLSLTGLITGSGSLIKTGAGTVTLTNITNSYTGDTYVEAGTLNVGASGAVMPANSNVTVSPGATFQLSFTSGSNSASPLGTLTLDGGTLFAPPTANPDYSLNQLVMTGGAVNLADSGPVLRLVGAGAALTTKASSTTATLFGNAFFGGALVNDTGSPAPINVAAGATASGIDLDAGIRLIANFVKVGAGTLRLTNTANEADFVVQQGALRVDAVGALGSGLLTVNGGRLAYGGDDATLSKPFTVDTLGGALDVLNSATILTVTSPVASNGLLTKTGPGVLVLDNLANQYAAGIAVSGGRLDVSDDAQLGLAAVTVNPLGVLRYSANTTAARTFTLNGGTLEGAAGVNVTLNGASVGGGFLRGQGAFELTGGTALTGVATLTSTTVTQTGPSSVANITNGGSFTVGAGRTLDWNGGTNTSSGRLVVDGTANVSDFVSDGQVNIPNGGVMNNTGAPLL